MNPLLVTIIVITYNSSKYVLETLESIKRQSYSNLELIISDDCSTDGTVVICKDFIRQNSHIEFIKKAQVVSTKSNSGITPNYNNGLSYATGKWVKFIAGDDMLTDDCIEQFIAEMKKKEDKLFVCGIAPFSKQEKFPEIIPERKYFNGSAKQQLKTLIRRGNFIAGPTIFVERDTLVTLGGFSEKYPFIEDFPLFIKFTSKGYRIHLVEKVLIRYRRHTESVSRTDYRFSESLNNHYREEVYPKLFNLKMYLFLFHAKILFFLYDHAGDGSVWSKACVRYFILCFDLISWHDFILKKIYNRKIHRF